MRWLHNKILSTIYNHLCQYPTPGNLTYFWGFGSLAGICLIIQIVSGIFLSMHYTPHIDYAFKSVEHIMRNVNHGWLIRYTHSNGASMFFIVIYMHIARGIYYRSYKKPRHYLWLSGLLLYILLMATAFLGYVLPWGQMSYWGATVITNLFTAIPYIGKDIAHWIWGGFAISNATLNRFFVLHFLLPFLMVGVSLLHLLLLHQHGSTKKIGAEDSVEYTRFLPYFTNKDLFGLCLFFLLFIFLVFFEPNLLGHPDNYEKANPLKTPIHIVPEWYFLPFYAILRIIPTKVAGVACMGASIIILTVLPYIDNSDIKNSPIYNITFKVNFFFFILSFISLGYLGGQPIEMPFTFLAELSTTYYFSYFLILILLQRF